jgi:hypothetical protein
VQRSGLGRQPSAMLGRLKGRDTRKKHQKGEARKIEGATGV